MQFLHHHTDAAECPLYSLRHPVSTPHHHCRPPRLCSAAMMCTAIFGCCTTSRALAGPGTNRKKNTHNNMAPRSFPGLAPKCKAFPRSAAQTSEHNSSPLLSPSLLPPHCDGYRTSTVQFCTVLWCAAQRCGSAFLSLPAPAPAPAKVTRWNHRSGTTFPSATSATPNYCPSLRMPYNVYW